MPGFCFARFAKFSLAIATLCLFFLPRSASADAADVVQYTFVGTATCIGIEPPDICGGTSITVNATFSFDDDTNSLTSWSVDAFGTECASGSGFYPGCLQDASVGRSGGIVNSFDASSGDQFIDLSFNSHGQLESGDILGGPTACDSETACTFTSGQLTATPEPSSLLLLGTGLIGLALVVRRHFISHEQESQSCAARCSA